MTKDELLAVLDLPEDEQFVKTMLLMAGDVSVDAASYWYKGKQFYSLADLAFRLRDEAVKQPNGQHYLCRALEIIYERIYCEKAYPLSMYAFLTSSAQPIHWIIAALIVKENK